MAVDFKWTLYEEGLIADRPTAGTDGRFYYATDEYILYRDNGTAWANVMSGTSAVVLKSLFDANTILKADVDDIPEALTVAEQRLVGRITDGVITALTGAQVMALLSGQAGAAFSLNGQDLSYVGHIGLGNTAPIDRLGIRYIETYAIDDNAWRAGLDIEIEAYKTSATFTNMTHGGFFTASISDLNTQDWTCHMALVGVEGYVHLKTGAAAPSTIAAAVSFYATRDIGFNTNDMVLTNYYGLYVEALSLVGNSKLTNCYGIKIEDLEGGAALNYAIHTGLGLVHFGDDVDIVAGKVLKTDTIDEITGAAGVTVDGVLIKDNEVDGTDISAHVVDMDAHQPLMIQGLTLVGTDLYVDDTAIGLRQVQLPDSYHLEFGDATGEIFYVAN